MASPHPCWGKASHARDVGGGALYLCECPHLSSVRKLNKGIGPPEGALAEMSLIVLEILGEGVDVA